MIRRTRASGPEGVREIWTDVPQRSKIKGHKSMYLPPTEINARELMEDLMTETMPQESTFDRLMREGAVHHSHEPCDACIASDKVYEKLAESYSVLESDRDELLTTAKALTHFVVHRHDCATLKNRVGARQIPMDCDCGMSMALEYLLRWLA